MGEREILMPGSARLQSLVLFSLCCCLSLPCALARAQTGSQDSLAKLEARIQGQKEDLEKLRAQETSVLAVLERVDQELDERNAELQQLNQLIRSHAEKVAATEASVDQVVTDLAAGRKAFLDRARALYKWHRGGSPFVLLTGDVSTLELMRRKRYLEIVLDHDRELIEGLARRAVELARLNDDLKRHRAGLNAERKRAVAARANVRRERERKRATLASVRREKGLRVRVLDELERASAKLQKLIDNSTKRAMRPESALKNNVPVRPPVSRTVATVVPEHWEGFENGKGKLDLPVRGTIIGGFGRRLHPDLRVDVQRHGLDIVAPEGEEIRAVDRGEVVFSNRLSGYGRMVIIDHGKRYFTVYAHLSRLHKMVGDRVQRGEAIAAVGDSGPSGQPRLYFEVRKDGRPIDPAPWFKEGIPSDRNTRSADQRSQPRRTLR